MGVSQNIINNENNYRGVIEFIHDNIYRLGIAERNFSFNRLGLIMFIAILIAGGILYFFVKKEENPKIKRSLETNPLTHKGVWLFMMVAVIISLFICSFRMGKYSAEAKKVKWNMIDQIDEHLDDEEIHYLLGSGYNKYMTDEAKIKVIKEKYYKVLRFE